MTIAAAAVDSLKYLILRFTAFGISPSSNGGDERTGNYETDGTHDATEPHFGY